MIDSEATEAGDDHGRDEIPSLEMAALSFVALEVTEAGLVADVADLTTLNGTTSILILQWSATARTTVGSLYG